MTKLSIRTALLLACASSVAISQAKQPGIQQKADNSRCANIVALAGNVNINCSTLTPQQKKLLESIPAILKKVLANQLDPQVVIAKLDEIREAQAKASAPIVSAPNGIAIGGGTVTNPTVNNNFAPPVKITASAQTQIETGNPNAPYARVFTISTNIPAQIGDFQFTCTGPVVTVIIDRISPYEWSTGRVGPDANDPNTVIYQVKPEPLNPNHNVTIKILSRVPVQVISGKAGDIPITF